MRYVPYVLCAGLFLSGPLIPGALAQIGGGETCTKGIWWPFVREQGDCLTDVERANGRTGVYQDPNAPPGTAAAPAGPAPAGVSPGQAAAPGSAPAPVMSGSIEPPIAASSAPAGDPVPAADENNCRKGILWPFVREPGDCLTDVEIANGRRGTYQ